MRESVPLRIDQTEVSAASVSPYPALSPALFVSAPVSAAGTDSLLAWSSAGPEEIEERGQGTELQLKWR